MALLPCPECNKMISEHALQCPHCGIDKKMIEKLRGIFESTIIGNTLLRFRGTGDTYVVPGDIKEIASINSVKNILINENCEKINCAVVGDVENIYVNKNNKFFESVDGVLYTKGLKKLLLYPNMRADTEFVLPIHTEIIGYKAFANNRFLRHLVCSKNLKEIQYQGATKIEYGFTFIGDCNRHDEIIVSMPENVKNLMFTYEYKKFIGEATPAMHELHDIFDRINVKFEFI